MRVVQVEVVGDDGHGQACGQDAGQGAHGAHHVAQPRLGAHVAVANGGQRDDSPPVAVRDGVEGVLHEELGVVDDDGEDEDDDEDKDDEHGQLAEGGFESQQEDLDSSVVPGEAQHATDSQHSEHHDEEEDRQQAEVHTYVIQQHHVPAAQSPQR